MKLQKILKSRKGFTLMELIVVLIIVAILAAALIPSFLNFVSRARNDSLMAQARVGMVAAQVLLTESGGPVLGTATTFTTLDGFTGSLSGTNTTTAAFLELVANDVTNTGAGAWTDILIAPGRIRINGITYIDENGARGVIAPRN